VAASVIAIALLLALAASAAAQVTPADPTTEYSHTFTYTGTAQELQVPAGVKSIPTTAIGGRGGGSGTKAGGLAARVVGPVTVQAPTALWVLVGGNANGTEGGYNGGAGQVFNGYALGGGGGGASDVRSIYPGDQGSLESRLIVAAGGGGAGGLANGSSGVKLNGAAGDAGAPGERAASGTPSNTIGSGGYGGHAGTSSAGGIGGEGGFSYQGGCGARGGNGGEGTEGSGGEGGVGPTNAPQGWGGGGGGGLFGGGGGGGGGETQCAAEPVTLSGGGGGGGSSLVPVGGTSVVDPESTSSPEVSVHWAIPGTVMEIPVEYTNQDHPAYKLSSEDADFYECRLVLEPSSEWEPCAAEGTVPTVGFGDYRFEARAVNMEGNFDPTPAALEFWVNMTPPVVVELNGPGETAETQPTFTFLGGSIIPVHFECAFDGATPGPCSGERSDRPAAPLSLGAHTISVTPIDAAGNVGTPATKAFTVVGPTPPPAPTPVAAPTLKPSGAPQVNPKTGTASVAFTVNGAGTVQVSGAGVKTVAVKVGGSGKVKLTIRPTGKQKKELDATGKAKVKVKITYTAADGRTKTVTKTVTLREPVPRQHGR
jgi:hypothetical protein